jgi:hypothetical protein
MHKACIAQQACGYRHGEIRLCEQQSDGANSRHCEEQSDEAINRHCEAHSAEEISY